MKPFLLAVVSISSFLFACKKDHSVVPPPSPAVNARIAVKLNNSYLPADKVDSAILVWETAGSVQQETMQLSNDTLFIKVKKLNKGAGTLTIQLFTKLELRHRNLQWEKRNVVTLKEQESLNMPAPVNYDDAAWFPRVILIDQPSNFTAIVGLRPADPYFLLKNVPPGFKIALERNYTAIPGGAVIVGGGLWKCYAVCTDDRGIIENREFFKPLQTQMANREWKMVEVGIGLF
jgi:hypothetical protein